MSYAAGSVANLADAAYKLPWEDKSPIGHRLKFQSAVTPELFMELLEACHALVLYDESDDSDGIVFMQRYAEAVDKARAAIAKATDAPSRKGADTARHGSDEQARDSA